MAIPTQASVRLVTALLAVVLACQQAEQTGSPSDTGGAGGNDVATGGRPATGGAPASGGASQATGGQAPPAPDASAAGGAATPDARGGTGGASEDASATGDRPRDDGPSGDGGGGPAPGGPSAGCGMRNMAGTFMITAGAATTPYRVVLPTNYDPAKPYPLVFYLHGRGNGIEGQGNLNRDVAAANLGIVVYPKSYGGSGWEVPNRDRPEENLALLRALIKEMAAKYCVDTKRVIMTGFSSGCWFASRLACTMKDELAAVVGAGCGLDPMGRCPDRKPFSYIIGRGDPQFGNAPAAADFYRTRNGCMATRKPAMPAPCESYDGCAAGFPTAYCVHPGGHMWPGFAAQTVVELLRAQ